MTDEDAASAAPAADPDLDRWVVELERLEQLLRRRVEDPAGRPAPSTAPSPRLAALEGLAARFGLDALEADIVLLALAPELDARYQHLFGQVEYRHDESSDGVFEADGGGKALRGNDIIGFVFTYLWT